MGPVTAISLDRAVGSIEMQPAAYSPRGGAAIATQSSSIQITSSTFSTRTTATNAAQSMVAQLLQALEDTSGVNKRLQMLIVALILLALLNAIQDESNAGAVNETLGRLGARATDRSQFVGIFDSSTTLSIEQSTTTITSTVVSAAFGSGDVQVLQGGSEMDLSA